MDHFESLSPGVGETLKRYPGYLKSLPKGVYLGKASQRGLLADALHSPRMRLTFINDLSDPRNREQVELHHLQLQTRPVKGASVALPITMLPWEDYLPQPLGAGVTQEAKRGFRDKT